MPLGFEVGPTLKPRRGGLFIDRASTRSFFLFFSPESFRGEKQKEEGVMVVAFYKQVTPTGFRQWLIHFASKLRLTIHSFEGRFSLSSFGGEGRGEEAACFYTSVISLILNAH